MPVTPALPYCQTILPALLTISTRLSTAPSAGSLGAPRGAPVPAIRVRPPGIRWASLGATTVLGPATDEPVPKCQTMCPSRATSMTRLLNWSAISTLPFWLKAGAAFATADPTQRAASRTATPTKANGSRGRRRLAPDTRFMTVPLCGYSYGFAGRCERRARRDSLSRRRPIRGLSRCGSSPARSAAPGRRGTSRGRARGAPVPRRLLWPRRRRAAACTRPRRTP